MTPITKQAAAAAQLWQRVCRRLKVAALLSCVVAAVLLMLATFGMLCLQKPLSRLLGCRQCCVRPAARPAVTATTATPASAVVVRADSLTQTSPFMARETATAAAVAAGMAHGSDLPHHSKSVDSTGGPGGWKGCAQGVCLGARQLIGHVGDARQQLGFLGLLVAALVASLCYCSVDLASTAVSAFQCTDLDPAGTAGMIPGERRAAQGSWWSKSLGSPCYGDAQVAAAVVAGAVCLPLLVLTILVVVAAVQAARYKQNTPTGHQLYTTWLSQLWGTKRVYQQCCGGERGSGVAGHRWGEALSATGVMFVAPFRTVSPAALWAVFALVFRVALAILVTAVDNALGSSVLLRAAVASGGIACVQLLLSCLQPAVRKRDMHTLGGCYMLLQVLCVLTVAAETLQPVGPASRAVLYTLLVIVGSANCLYMAFRAAQSFFACLV